MNKAPYFLYYTRNLPARSVPIAYLSTPAATPEQLTSINNIMVLITRTLYVYFIIL